MKEDSNYRIVFVGTKLIPTHTVKLNRKKLGVCSTKQMERKWKLKEKMWRSGKELVRRKLRGK